MKITKVTFTTRNDIQHAKRTKNVRIYVSDALPETDKSPFNSAHLFGEYSGPSSAGKVVEISGEGQGKVMVLQMKTDVLTLAEIHVESSGIIKIFLWTKKMKIMIYLKNISLYIHK